MIRGIPKPWGEEIIFAHTERYAGKILNIRRGESLSLQYHERKDETIYLYRGTLKVILEVDGRLEERLLEAGEALRFPPRTRHRMAAAGRGSLDGRYTLTRMVGETEQLYEELLNREAS